MLNTQAQLYEMYHCIKATIWLVRLDWFSSMFFSFLFPNKYNNWHHSIQNRGSEMPICFYAVPVRQQCQKKRLVTDVFCTLGVRSGPNKMNPITGQDTRSPSAAPNWLIDEQIIFINNSVTATALSAFVSWQQASADVIHALYVTAYCHLNNTSAITHALQSNAIDGASENLWAFGHWHSIHTYL